MKQRRELRLTFICKLKFVCVLHCVFDCVCVRALLTLRVDEAHDYKQHALGKNCKLAQCKSSSAGDAALLLF